MNRVTQARGECLEVIAPSQAQAGSPFTITIAAFLPNGRTNWHFDGTVQIATQDARAKGTGQVHVIPVAGGAYKHTITLFQPGIQRLVVHDKEHNLKTVSNPIHVREETPDLSLYWGDLHVHAGERHRHLEISDAYATIDYNYHFGRHVAGLDFMAMADHDQLGSWRRGIIPIWDRFKRAAEYFYRPGEFVTLLGWEWTNGVSFCPGQPQYGQKCVYFRDANGPIYSSADPGSDTPEKLYDRLRSHRCFIIPHHVSAPLNFYNDWDHHDPGLERLVEIHSGWGCGERSADDGNPYPIRPGKEGDVEGHHVKDALSRGHTLGFTAGGDTHDAAPGLGHTYNGLQGAFEAHRWGGFTTRYHPGIQGVWAEELTREGIFEAIFSRRTYGTTGARITVKTELHDKPMGTVFPVRPDAPVTYTATVSGTGPVEKVELVRNGETIDTATPGSDEVEYKYTDTHVPDDRVSYYLRVTQQDGHMAWASPHYLPASG